MELNPFDPFAISSIGRMVMDLVENDYTIRRREDATGKDKPGELEREDGGAGIAWQHSLGNTEIRGDINLI